MEVVCGLVVLVLSCVFVGSWCWLISYSMEAPPGDDDYFFGDVFAIVESKGRGAIHVPPLRPVTELGKLLYFRPTTLVLGVVNALVFLWIRCKGGDVALVGASTVEISEKREYYRSLTAAFAHVSPWHFLMNMASWDNVGSALEPRIGSLKFLSKTFVAIVVGDAMACLIDYALAYVFGDSILKRKRIGFSGVLFSWTVVATTLQGSYCLPLGFCFSTYTFRISYLTLQLNAAPFVLLAAIQMIVPNASFVGHLSGLLAGYPLTLLLENDLSFSPAVLLLAVALFDRLRWPSQERPLAAQAAAPATLLIFMYGTRYMDLAVSAAVLFIIATGTTTFALLLALAQALSYAALAGILFRRTSKNPAYAASAVALSYAVASAILLTHLDDDNWAKRHLKDLARYFSSLLLHRRRTPVLFSGPGQVLGSSSSSAAINNPSTKKATTKPSPPPPPNKVLIAI